MNPHYIPLRWLYIHVPWKSPIVSRSILGLENFGLTSLWWAQKLIWNLPGCRCLLKLGEPFICLPGWKLKTHGSPCSSPHSWIKWIFISYSSMVSSMVLYIYMCWSILIDQWFPTNQTYIMDTSHTVWGNCQWQHLRWKKNTHIQTLNSTYTCRAFVLSKMLHKNRQKPWC